jgi:Tol biopolymer transport system component
VWLTDVARSVATRFTFDPAGEYSPVWSPDSTQVVFRSVNRNAAGSSDLYIKPANSATDEKPLLVSPDPKVPLDWSRHGRLLLYASQDPKTQSDLWVLPLTGADTKPFPVVQTTFSETQGQFSPDGHWLAYTLRAPQALFSIRLATGPGISLTGYASRALYDVTADGRFLVSTNIEPDHTAPIMIVQNWDALLKR